MHVQLRLNLFPLLMCVRVHGCRRRRRHAHAFVARTLHASRYIEHYTFDVYVFFLLRIADCVIKFRLFFSI